MANRSMAAKNAIAKKYMGKYISETSRLEMTATQVIPQSLSAAWNRTYIPYRISHNQIATGVKAPL